MTAKSLSNVTYDFIESEITLEIREPGSKYAIKLDERLLKFAIMTFAFFKSLPDNKEYDVFRYQLSKSVTSIGANLPCEIK